MGLLQRLERRVRRPRPPPLAAYAAPPCGAGARAPGPRPASGQRLLSGPGSPAVSRLSPHPDRAPRVYRRRSAQRDHLPAPAPGHGRRVHHHGHLGIAAGSIDRAAAPGGAGREARQGPGAARGARAGRPGESGRRRYAGGARDRAARARRRLSRPAGRGGLFLRRAGLPAQRGAARAGGFVTGAGGAAGAPAQALPRAAPAPCLRPRPAPVAV